MLDVRFNSVAVAAVLLCIIVPGFRAELDSLNSTTAKPILGGVKANGDGSSCFQGAMCH